MRFAHIMKPVPLQTVPGHWHAPETHVSPGGHIMPHDPQCRGSLDTSVHPPPHMMRPAPQLQTPDTHVAPMPQLVPHAPQCIGSVETSVHVPPHEICDPGHAHAPAVHVAPIAQR
jgi:hypothetical protein